MYLDHLKKKLLPIFQKKSAKVCGFSICFGLVKWHSGGIKQILELDACLNCFS